MTEPRTIEAPRGYGVAWAIGVVVATICTPVVIAFKTSAPWVILVPIAIGAVCVCVCEFRWSRLSRLVQLVHTISEKPEELNEPPKQDPFADFQLLHNYDDVIALEIKAPKKRVPASQLAFKNFPVANPSNSVRYLTDPEGQRIAVITCEKFSALLIAYLVDRVDESTDAALFAGLTQFMHSKAIKGELEPFLNDANVREIVKSKFRGSMATTIAQGGQKVVKDLSKVMEEQAKRAKEEVQQKVADFRLESP